jgi:hypothetical protein
MTIFAEELAFQAQVETVSCTVNSQTAQDSGATSFMMCTLQVCVRGDGGS